MSEDEEHSISSVESTSSRSMRLGRGTNNVDISADESATDAGGSDKDGSQTDCSTDNEEEDLDGEETRGDSGSCSDSSGPNSGSEDDERGHSDSSHSRGSQSASGTRSSRSPSGSEHSDNQSHDDVDIKKLWQTDPDFYGIRRSSRQKEASDSKPPKLLPQVKSSSAKVSSKQSRKRRLSSSEESSDDEEVARTVRKRASQAVNYKEDDSEEDEVSDDNDFGNQQVNGKLDEPEEQVETIERIMDHRIGHRGATGSGTTVYAVAERGDPNLLVSGSSEKESQFLIKWAGWSHLHNTWESLETLQETKAKGLKKLDNYCRREDEISRWKSKANPEDIEYYECQLELQQELTKAYINAERIIAEHKGSDGLPEYYVKWECLPYADATWEQGALTQKRYPRVIEEFKKRDASTRTPSGSAKSLRSRPKFVQIKSQPSYMASDSPSLELRDYQLDGVNWLVHSWCKDNSVILADEMGLGKTIQTICFLSYLFEAQGLHGPYLIVVPLSTMAAWQREFAQWAPQINVVTYLGDVSSRDIIREYEWFFKSSRKIKFNAILTTYEIVLKDKTFLSSLSWAILMVDEAHRLKNGDSLLYKTLSDFDTSHRLLITGTPLQNSLKELWSLLHFIMPHKFDDWESFEKEHDNAATKGYSKLHKQLEPFIIRRVKKDVEKSLPAKVEQILRVEMTNLQKQYYKWILTKNYNALRKGLKGSVSSFVNVVMELKKCCNHAQLVKPIENPAGDSLSALIKGSGKLMLLDKLLVRLKETGHRVLIFSQMVRMLDIIAEYLQSRRFAFQRLDGSIKGDLRKQALDHFNSEGSNDFCFLLSTRAGGLGINLATADTVIIFDSDWNPQNDLQAQARAHRIGQKNQVNIYRLVTKNSVEEDIVERAKRKMVLDHLVIQRMDTTGRTVLDKGSKTGTPFNKDELNAILKFGAEELFKEDENEGDDNCDIDEILRRAETHEEPGERPGDELLSAFKVASFAVNEDEDIDSVAVCAENKDWEQIIPEDLRKKAEDEEKEKEMADLFLPPRSSRAAHREQEESKESGIGGVKKARKKRKRDESEESGSEGEGRPRKRGRPRMYGRVSVKGFNDNQIRRFIRSFKRFPKPLLRIDVIARDADLSEKSLSDLKKLGESLYQKCVNSIAEAKANPVPVLEEPQSVPEDSASTAGAVTSQEGVKKKQKPREKGPIFKISGVAVNARTLSNALEELEPLGEAIPKDEAARKEWKFEYRAKATSFDVEWGPAEDTRLLLGVWEHGMGAWQTIRESDPVLKDKVFLEGEKKPQLKHIHTRAEYLIRVLKKNSLQNSKSLSTKIRKKRVDKRKVGEEEKGGNLVVPNAGLATSGDAGMTESSKDDLEPNLVKAKSKRGRKKKDVGPMHFTTGAEPTPLNVLGDLDPVVFNECKEKMRPVKKALKALDKFDPALSEKEQIRHTRNCLMQIGDQIQSCIADITDPAQLKQSKTNLWYFVSKFTEYDPAKLYKLYKKASKKEKKDGKSSKSSDKVDKSKSDKERDKSGSKERHHRDKKERGVDRKDSQRVRDKIRNNERPRSAEIRDRGSKAGLLNDFRERERGSELRERSYQREWDRSHDRPVGDARERDFDRSPGDARDRSVSDQRDRAPVDPRESYRLTGDQRERDRLPGDQRERDRLSGDQRERDRLSGDQRERDRLSGDQRERDRLSGDQRERDRLPGDQRERDRLSGDQRERDRSSGDQRERDRLPSDQRERDRLTGDQRDYERSPVSFNRHHFDRDRGDRGWNDRTPRGRPWGPPKNRWNAPPLQLHITVLPPEERRIL